MSQYIAAVKTCQHLQLASTLKVQLARCPQLPGKIAIEWRSHSHEHTATHTQEWAEKDKRESQHRDFSNWKILFADTWLPAWWKKRMMSSLGRMMTKWVKNDVSLCSWQRDEWSTAEECLCTPSGHWLIETCKESRLLRAYRSTIVPNVMLSTNRISRLFARRWETF